MSKARRNRAQRQQVQRAQPGASRQIRTIEDIDAAGELFITDMPCRVTYLNDPVFGRMRPAAGIDPGGNLIADNSGTVEAIPVVLFEPAQIMVMKDKVTGMVQEGKTGGIVAAGFHRVPGHPGLGSPAGTRLGSAPQARRAGPARRHRGNLGGWQSHARPRLGVGGGELPAGGCLLRAEARRPHPAKDERGQLHYRETGGRVPGGTRPGPGHRRDGDMAR